MVPPSALRGAARAALTLALILFPAFAFAVGPVAPSSLPGGVAVSDSDSGSGESWGRPGGRTITFSVNTPAAFSSLSWGAVSSPTAALDGLLNSPSETMSFSSVSSNLPAGLAQWTGFAPVFVVAPSSQTIMVETRFTLLVTTPGGVGIPLALTSGGPSPGINVLPSGSFRVNLLFEGRLSSTSTNWVPLLHLYDQLDTPVGNPPGTSGPALTGFSHGFYYETVSAPPPGGMTVEEHDNNVVPRLIGIRDDTAFLRIDTVGRFQDVQAGLDEVRTRVNMLPTEFPTFPEIPEIPSDIATSEHVSSAKNDLTDMLLILFGLAPCPAEAGPLCDSAIFIQDLATQASVDGVGEALTLLQDSLADVASQSSVDSISTRVTQLGSQLDTIETSLGGLASADPLSVEVIEVPDPPSPKHRRWIVKTTQGGALVDASLSRILSIRSKKLLPALAEDVTFRASAMAIGPGLLDVTLETDAGNGETVVYQIEVQHAGGDGTSEASALLATGAR